MTGLRRCIKTFNQNVNVSNSSGMSWLMTKGRGYIYINFGCISSATSRGSIKSPNLIPESGSGMGLGVVCW